jgi:hypothetical protein
VLRTQYGGEVGVGREAAAEENWNVKERLKQKKINRKTGTFLILMRFGA